MKHCKWKVCSAVWSRWHSSCEEIECPEWHKWFKEGQENIGDVEGSCYPEMHRSDKNTSKLSYLVRQGKSTSQAYICRSIGEVTWSCAQESSWTLGQQVVLPSWLSTLLSAVSRRVWEKRWYWTGTATLLTRLGMWLFPKLMSTLKGWRF